MVTRYKVCEKDRYILYHLDSDFAPATAAEMFCAIRNQLDVEITYSELIAFNPNADLSHINQVDFLSIMESMKDAFENTGIKRDKTAIVVGLSEPLRPMTSLWVGYCELDPEISTLYKSFYELAAACEWIELPMEKAVDFLHGN